MGGRMERRRLRGRVRPTSGDRHGQRAARMGWGRAAQRRLADQPVGWGLAGWVLLLLPTVGSALAIAAREPAGGG